MGDLFESLALIHDEVRAERDAQLRHADALDAKAGIIVGFSGVIVAIGASAGLALARFHVVDTRIAMADRQRERVNSRARLIRVGDPHAGDGGRAPRSRYDDR